MIHQKTVEALAAARLSGEKLTEYPGPQPKDMAEAFAIQCAVRDRLGWRPAGWKVGCSCLKAQAALKSPTPIMGPVYRERLYKSGAHVETLASNFRTTEPEIAFTLARDLSPRNRPYTVDEVLAAVATVHPSIEIVNPRLPKGFGDSVDWYVADGSLNHALVLGEGVEPLARDDYARIEVKVKLNGVDKCTGIGANALGGPEKVLTWLANELLARDQHLKAGHVVTTGVITDVFDTMPGDEVVADYTRIGTVSVRL